MQPYNNASQPNVQNPIKVMHFVTGGFSGSTSVAVELVKSTLDSDHFSSLLVLRQKKSTPLERIKKLQDDNITVEIVPGWLHIATIFALVKLCKKYKPDILVCHGFSEHLWGRYAGLIAKVPHLIHVEHNSKERYNVWRLAQARWLAKFTDAIVGCSDGVKQRLLELRFPPEKTISINNGINISAYNNIRHEDFAKRAPNIVMAARFASQKDHTTLIRAIALLAKKNLYPHVFLAGAGSKRHIKIAQQLTQQLQLQDRIHFLGYTSKVPELLMQNQICVLSTHYEGMPLALSEGMAAGCAVVASAVVGVQEMIRHNKDGLLVAHQSPEALADALASLLINTEFAATLAKQAQIRAQQELTLSNMTSHYENLFSSIFLQHPIQQQP